MRLCLMVSLMAFDLEHQELVKAGTTSTVRAFIAFNLGEPRDRGISNFTEAFGFERACKCLPYRHLLCQQLPFEVVP